MNSQISITAIVHCARSHTWDCYTLPEHIVQWNFAHPSWHCPRATNELKVGGTYFARMEAKDGSFGFDFEAVYTELEPKRFFSYQFGDRTARILFDPVEGGTQVSIHFDPETENSIEDQRNGWKSILNNFKAYCEAQFSID